jgi:glycosyltransferase involved in cell wall biosynthesis
LIDFISKWSARHPQHRLTIAGCGTGAEKDCPADLLKSGQVRIVPSFKREALYSLLAEHDAGLFTSKVEGWGLSLNEMLESGMEVFATAAGATSDLQPFFNTLRPFPPPLNFMPESPTSEVGIVYYETFNWAEIARKYVTLILPRAVIMEPILTHLAND